MTRKLAAHWQILIAIVLGVLFGLIIQRVGIETMQPVLVGLDLVGTVFLNGLKLLVIPLVVSCMIIGVASAGSSLGRLGGYTLMFYLVTTLLAVLVGLFFVNLFTPGISNGVPAADLLALPTDQEGALSKVAGKSLSDVLNIITDMVPPNLMEAMVNGNLLGVIVFSIVFGACITGLPEPLKQTQLSFWEGCQHIFLKMTQLVLMIAPLGVFALITATVAKTGFDALQPMMVFFFTVLLALVIHTFGVLSIILYTMARVSPLKHIKAMIPVLLTAFSTASSNATVPVTMRALQERSGVSERISSLTIPLGATINMNGTALYECVAALFLAQAYGLELTIVQQALVVVIALLTSLGVAGIPAASLVAIAIILGSLGLPLDAIGILLITDRILDMCRTAVNVYSDTVAAVLVAHREGEPLTPIRP